MKILTVRQLHRTGPIQMVKLFGDEAMITRRAQHSNDIELYRVERCGDDEHTDLTLYSAKEFKENMRQIMDGLPNVGDGCRVAYNKTPVDPASKAEQMMGVWVFWYIHKLENAPTKSLTKNDIPESVKFDAVQFGTQMIYLGREVD